MADRVIRTIRVTAKATKAELERAIAERRARGEWPAAVIPDPAAPTTPPPPKPER